MRQDELRIRMTAREDDIPVESFNLCIEEIVSILRDLDEIISESNRHSIKWKIAEISMNSPLQIVLFPASLPSKDYGREVITVFTDGMRELEESARALPRFFTNKILESIKRISGLLNNDFSGLDFFNPYTESVSITLQSMVNADKLLDKEYRDYITIEGQIELISVHGDCKFNIYDAVYGRIECKFKEDSDFFKRIGNLKVDEVFSLRVEVSGMAKHNRNGKPNSIDIETVGYFLPQSDLPQIDDLTGINITNGVDSVEYISRMRNDSDIEARVLLRGNS